LGVLMANKRYVLVKIGNKNLEVSSADSPTLKLAEVD